MDKATTRRHKPNRMAEYDYASAGVYVITVVVYERRCCLGHVDGEDFVSSDAGRIIRSAWERLFARFPTIMLDAFRCNTNNCHGIIVLSTEPGFGREVAMNGDATVSPVASPFMAASLPQRHFQNLESTNLRSLGHRLVIHSLCSVGGRAIVEGVQLVIQKDACPISNGRTAIGINH